MAKFCNHPPIKNQKTLAASLTKKYSVGGGEEMNTNHSIWRLIFPFPNLIEMIRLKAI